MRTINYRTWVAAILIVVGLSPVMAQTERETNSQPSDTSKRVNGMTSEDMSRIQERKWMLEQQIELYNLRKELNALQSPDPSSDQSDSQESEKKESEKSGDDSIYSNPERELVMTQYSLYGDSSSATVVNRFGEMQVQEGSNIGNWEVVSIGSSGIQVTKEGKNKRMIPFKDQWSPQPVASEDMGRRLSFPGSNR